MSQGSILIVTGASGVGKSTVSQLAAAALEETVHLRMDDFTRFIVNTRNHPWTPGATRESRVLGGAVLAAATAFADGGYTVIVDGHVLPASLEELARAFRHRAVPLHYAVLRCDLATCTERAARRDDAERPDPNGFAQLHARFENLGEHEPHVVEAAGAPDEVAVALLDAFRSGRLAATGSSTP